MSRWVRGVRLEAVRRAVRANIVGDGRGERGGGAVWYVASLVYMQMIGQSFEV